MVLGVCDVDSDSTKRILRLPRLALLSVMGVLVFNGRPLESSDSSLQ